MITISEEERRDWKRMREAKKLTTRQLGKAVGVTHSTVTNIEVGTQRQAKRSIYTAIVSVLHGVSGAQAEIVADEAIARNDAAFKRLVKALAGLPIEQVEAFALGVEAGKSKK